MEQTILNAVDRTMHPKQCRAAGFTPGVLYGDSVTNAVTVQFEAAELKKIIARHGANAKVFVNYGGDKKFGFIKEVQRDPMTLQLLHTDVYLVSQDHEVKMQIPINFEGRDSLDNVMLQVQKNEVDVIGKAVLMPESVTVDVSTMVLGDTITAKNFNLDKQIQITDSEDEVYATITTIKELAEVPETVVVATETEVVEGADAETEADAGAASGADTKK